MGMLVFLLYSQVNSRNHSYARHVNTFVTPPWWLTHEEPISQAGAAAVLSVAGRDIISSYDFRGCFSALLSRVVSLHWHPKSGTATGVHLHVEGCSLSLWEQFSNKSTVLIPQHATYMVAGVSQIFCHFSLTEALNNGCDGCWILKQGCAFIPTISSQETWRMCSVLLIGKVNACNLVEILHVFLEINTGGRKPSGIWLLPLLGSCLCCTHEGGSARYIQGQAHT